MTQAAVYARISSDDGTALGVARQLADCLALAEQHGWTVVEQFVDNDVSASSGRTRPQYERMMQALASGRLSALVVWDVDRLTRTPRELEDVVDLAEKHGIALASVGGDIDLATPQGRLTARIKGGVAKHESEQLARRIRRKMAERAAVGAPHGPPSYGWRREQVQDDQGRRLGSRDVVHPEQAEVVQESARAVLAGESLRSIAAELNRRGEVTVTGKPWNANAVKLVLLRPRNIGLRVHQGQVVGRGTWEPILDEQTHQRLVAMLKDPSRRTSTGTTVKYLLSGLAKCGVCGSGMRVLVAGKDGRKTDSYTCFSGYHVRRSRPALEELVRELVVARLGRPDAAAALARDDGEQVQHAIDECAAIRARLDLAADSYAEGEIDAQQLARITGKLRPQLEKWQQIARAGSTAPDLLDLAVPDIAGRWETLPLSRQRAVIDLLLEINVLPVQRSGGRNSFDPLSVQINWKTGTGG